MNTLKVDWDGYTIGYYGRIFEARNKTKGGSFEVQIAACSLLKDESSPSLLWSEELWHRYLFKYELDCFFNFELQGGDKDFFKFKLGSGQVIY